MRAERRFTWWSRSEEPADIKAIKEKIKKNKVDDWTIEELNGINRRDRKWFNHLEGIYDREL